MFEVTNRDTAARTGKLTLGEKIVTTPSLLLIEHERFTPELPENIVLLSLDTASSDNEKDELPKIEGIPLREIKEIYRGSMLTGDPKSIAGKLVSSRIDSDYSTALYLPGTGVVSDYAQLVYSGADLFDASRLILSARQGNYCTSDGPVKKTNWKPGRCYCPGCIDENDDFHSILTHNIIAALQELSAIRTFIAQRKLRHLVEMRIRSHPELVSIQRLLDRDHYDFFRKRLGFIGGGVIAVSENSLHEPVIRNYREKIADYRKPGGEVLILLPCSARKPYSTSKSHRLFSNVTGFYQGLVHEVIVTSPLGLVPRELENFYPATNYEISVTGEWSRSEMDMIRSMISTFIENNEYSTIIDHTPYGFVSEFLHDLKEQGNINDTTRIVKTVKNGKATSSESLHNLRSELGSLNNREGRQPMESWKRATFGSMWWYQFGTAPEELFSGTKVRGKFPFFKLHAENGQLAMMVPKSMRISLTLEGAKHLGAGTGNRVFIEDFNPSGDIFAVGIHEADEGIRVGDEVAVVYRKDEDSELELRGAGVAGMSGSEMVGSRRGVGVKLRHKGKK